jgi:perosamine synthetase
LTSSTTETTTRAIPFGRPWIDESDRRAVADVLSGPILTHGPAGVEFEQRFSEFLGDGAHSVTVSSCAAALHLAYAHFGVGPGDEVIVPAQTHAATANTAEWTGASCVFVDCDPATGNMRADAVRAAITPRTKAITVVHFLGIPCEMPSLVELADEHGIPLIEDCALSLGARLDDTHTGLFGDVGCFSFYPVKHITTGEGGMFVSRHADVAEKVARLRAHGVDRTHSERSVPGMYDVPSIGLNYRMSEMQAALGSSQLRRIEEILTRRRGNFDSLRDALAPLDGVRVLDGPGSSWYCLGLVLEGPLSGRRDALIDVLKTAGVGTSIYYPRPVPRMTYYSTKYGYDATHFPGAEELSDSSISLPVGPHLSADDAEFVRTTTVSAIERIAA